MASATGFHDVSFPLAPGRGMNISLERLTEIVELRSGFEERNAVWAAGRRRYDAGPLVRSREDLRALAAFFEARLGRLYAFRFRDPLDHASRDDGAPPTALDQFLGTGDGEKTRFALTKRYFDAGGSIAREIALPVHDTVIAAVSGAPASFTIADGALVFDAPPPAGAAVTAGYQFDTPVRFDTDRLEMSLDGARFGEAGEVALVEVRLAR